MTTPKAISGKRFVILTSGGGELANQLWNFISIYAYALHSGATVSNPSFFEYHQYFKFLTNESSVTRFFSFWFKGAIRRRAHPINQFWRRLYSFYAKVMTAMHRNAICSSQNETSAVTYLPPSADFEVPANRTVYFKGWLFRNPKGLVQYGAQLREAFRPSAAIEARVVKVMRDLYSEGKTILGIHIRQGDYATFKDGAYLIPPARMKVIVDAYLEQRGLARDTVVLFIASDGPVAPDIFSEYSTYFSKENAVTDIFLLAACDAVIGSNSSFGHFASWYGNVPHIVAQTESMDWSYYHGHTEYFENKYATLARL